ncbi:hypothetical protein M9194_10450 [Vibrio sp. S4M6]|uniref:hypothetical protein n=1 Tax=Vibrio sinus TaxID=2946865 RepID=UPI002029D019|nr:hypothetical protein [Vibrio sinus]MCL9781847.1 hypothetical protein [Vibrio sinus]
MDNVFDKLSSLKSHSYSMPQLESMDSIQVGTSTYSVSKTDNGFEVERDNIPEGPSGISDWRGARDSVKNAVSTFFTHKVSHGTWKSQANQIKEVLTDKYQAKQVENQKIANVMREFEDFTSMTMLAFKHGYMYHTGNQIEFMTAPKHMRSILALEDDDEVSSKVEKYIGDNPGGDTPEDAWNTIREDKVANCLSQARGMKYLLEQQGVTGFEEVKLEGIDHGLLVKGDKVVDPWLGVVADSKEEYLEILKNKVRQKALDTYISSGSGSGSVAKKMHMTNIIKKIDNIRFP